MNYTLTYEQSLAEMIRGEADAPVLGPFWRNQSNWPKGNKDMIFLGDALQRIGELKFLDAWSGMETHAQRLVSSLPTFSSSLEFHWDRIRGNPLAGSLPSDSEALGEHNADLRAAYDRALADRKKLKQSNNAARERLNWAIAWIANQGRLKNLDTHLRALKTDRTLGLYKAFPEGIWDVENVIFHRFRDGHMKLDLPSGRTESYFIFFSKISFDRSSLELSPFDAPSEFDDIHLSSFMRGIIDAIRTLRITASNQLTTGEITDHLIKHWKGAEPLTPTMARRMATVMREEDSQRGAWKQKPSI